MGLEFFEDQDGLTRWHTKADNGHITADSGQGYKQTDGAEKGAVSALKTILNSDVDGVLEAVVEYVEGQAAKGLFIIPGGNGVLVGERRSTAVAAGVEKSVKNWKP